MFQLHHYQQQISHQYCSSCGNLWLSLWDCCDSGWIEVL